jgi:hypothetical protein
MSEIEKIAKQLYEALDDVKTGHSHGTDWCNSCGRWPHDHATDCELMVAMKAYEEWLESRPG